MSANEVIGLVVACVFLLGVIPIVGGLMHVRRERLLTHTERMKALELGVDLEHATAPAQVKVAAGQSAAVGEGKNALATKCFSTAVWVAFWGFAAAAGLGGADVSAGVAYAIASSAGAIGVTAIICGTVLAARAPVAVHPDSYAKRSVEDADAYDVVSCRG